MEVVANNIIPLDGGSFLGFYTKNGTCNGKFGMPTDVTNCEELIIKDLGGYANICTITLNSTNSNVFDSGSSITLSTSNISKRVLYIGNGTSGLLTSV